MSTFMHLCNGQCHSGVGRLAAASANPLSMRLEYQIYQIVNLLCGIDHTAHQEPHSIRKHSVAKRQMHSWINMKVELFSFELRPLMDRCEWQKNPLRAGKVVRSRSNEIEQPSATHLIMRSQAVANPDKWISVLLFRAQMSLRSPQHHSFRRTFN